MRPEGNYKGTSEGWMPISEHDGSRKLCDWAWYYVPSAFAAMNGATESWCFGTGMKIGELFTDILGGNPSHFRYTEE